MEYFEISKAFLSIWIPIVCMSRWTNKGFSIDTGGLYGHTFSLEYMEASLSKIFSLKSKVKI